MSNHEFENYLALVSRLLRLNGSQKEMIRDELRDHLETRVSEMVESGVEPNEAMRKALEEFGDAALLAQKFQSVFHVNQRRWMMRFATFSIAGTFVAAVLIMAMWPSPARFGAPSSSIAQSDLTAENDRHDSAEMVSAPTTSVHPPRIKNESSRMRSSEDVNQILQQSCKLEYDENPFLDVMNDLQQQYDFNVLLDASARDDMLTEDTLITFAIRNVRLSTALRLMLKQHNATYMIHDGILRIISFDVASDPEFFSRRIFDCRELLQQIAKTDDRVGTPIRIEVLGANLPGRGRGGNAKGGSGGGVFNVTVPGRWVPNVQEGSEVSDLLGNNNVGQIYNGLMRGSILAGMNGRQDSNDEDDTQPSSNGRSGGAGHDDTRHPPNRVIVHEVTAESILSNLIRLSIDPDGWNDTNGDGTLSIVSGFMVVTQSQETLDEISRFIQELEKRLK